MLMTSSNVIVLAVERFQGATTLRRPSWRVAVGVRAAVAGRRARDRAWTVSWHLRTMDATVAAKTRESSQSTMYWIGASKRGLARGGESVERKGTSG